MAVLSSRATLASLVTLATFACAAPPALPPDAVCRSLDGRPLRAKALDDATRTRLEGDLAAAEAAFAQSPHDRDAAVWVGRRLAYLGRHHDAIDVFTRALAEHPRDPFLLRHRGHRWLTLREPARAAADLEAAAVACRTTPDAVEPDGRPTPGRPPHGSLHYNVHYHLGLARFLLADFAGAERAWLDCLAVVGNDESRVAVTHWLWCARMRQGNVAGAAAVVATIRPDMDVVDNRGYLQACLVYAGKLQRDDVVVPAGSAGAALTFALAHHAWVTGDRERGRRELRELAGSAEWTAFGVLAAEAEVARL